MSVDFSLIASACCSAASGTFSWVEVTESVLDSDSRGRAEVDRYDLKVDLKFLVLGKVVFFCCWVPFFSNTEIFC